MTQSRDLEASGGKRAQDVLLRACHVEPGQAIVSAQHGHLATMVRRGVVIGFDRKDRVASHAPGRQMPAK
jgi:hypothetical protein